MNKWLLSVKYFLFWVIFFIAAKAVFVIYHHEKTFELTTEEVLKIFGYGLRLDFSFAAYLCLIPFLLFFSQAIFLKLPVNRFLRAYSTFLLLFISFLTVSDLELYR